MAIQVSFILPYLVVLTGQVDWMDYKLYIRSNQSRPLVRW